MAFFFFSCDYVISYLGEGLLEAKSKCLMGRY